MFELRGIIDAIWGFIAGILTNIGLPQPIIELVGYAILAVVIFVVLSVLVLALIWLERKVSAHMQDRLGPMRVGWHGVIQTVADTIKLLQKEDITPKAIDFPIHFWAPVITIVAAIMVYVTIPFGEGLIVSDLSVGLLYIVAITTFTVIGLLMAGWGSNNKYSLLGGFRSAAQVISYEVPMTLAMLGVIMIAQTLSLGALVGQQDSIIKWYIWRQPLGFLIFFIAATAECNRTPFDLPEADSELVAGFVTEYSGMKFAMFFLAEFINMFTASAVTVTLFFGGWMSPFGPEFGPSWFWFFAKSLGFVFVLMWFRWTYPRLRVDQLMGFAWKVLLPLAFLNIILTGIGIYIFD
jgi:NADH-quinone oxidoreductase subunit H